MHYLGIILVLSGFLASISPSGLIANAFSIHNNPSLRVNSSSSHNPATRMSSMTNDAATAESKHVVIVGAGVVGTCTAYYLARNHADIVSKISLVDISGRIAPAASGKAGGFLAYDWNDWSPAGPLTRRSFDLHQEQANELGAERLQYRRLTCASVAVGSSAEKPKGQKLKGVEWANGARQTQSLGDESTIAQVHPKMLCNTLWEETQTLLPTSELLQGRASKLVCDVDDDRVIGLEMVVEKEGEHAEPIVLNSDAVMVSCGPWTGNIMQGVKYHSVVMPTSKVLSQCVFFSGAGDPEVYVRPDQTAYCCGFPDPSVHVTEEPGHEEVRAPAVQRIVDAVATASGGTIGREDGDGGFITNACYLPQTPDGQPIMGALPKSAGGGKGAYIATGHGCWGILMGPATGEAMASLIATGESLHVPLDCFDAARFTAMKVLTS